MKDWLKAAAPRSQFTYFVGNLSEEAAYSKEIMKLQLEALAAWEAGEVELIQRKLSTGGYEYIMIKRVATRGRRFEGCYTPVDSTYCYEVV
jgi:hypothetical protein